MEKVRRLGRERYMNIYIYIYMHNAYMIAVPRTVLKYVSQTELERNPEDSGCEQWEGKTRGKAICILQLADD